MDLYLSAFVIAPHSLRESTQAHNRVSDSVCRGLHHRKRKKGHDEGDAPPTVAPPRHRQQRIGQCLMEYRASD